MDSLTTDLGKKQYFSLVETTALRYREAGRFVYGFVRGKLMHDPVYREILYMNILPDQGKVVDLGCGRGILLTLLTTFRQLYPPDRNLLTFQGIELRESDARIARDILGVDADIINADILSVRLPDCQAVILLDVLMYMRQEDQEALLKEVFRALPPNGFLIIREADADAGLAFWAAGLIERVCALSRGHWWQRYGYRSQQEWKRLLEQLGFFVESSSMSQGTPFANILFIARLNHC